MIRSHHATMPGRAARVSPGRAARRLLTHRGPMRHLALLSALVLAGCCPYQHADALALEEAWTVYRSGVVPADPELATDEAQLGGAIEDHLRLLRKAHE